MKEFIRKLLDEHSSKILPFLVGILSVFIIFTFFDIFEDDRPDLDKPGIILEDKNVYKISTQKSKNFISCVYEQLECYNKNAGMDKQIILDACKDINYCDEMKEDGKK